MSTTYELMSGETLVAICHDNITEIMNTDLLPLFFKLNLFEIKKLLIPLPPIELQNEFAEFAKEVDKSKFIVQQQIKDLQKLFDKKMGEFFGD